MLLLTININYERVNPLCLCWCRIDCVRLFTIFFLLMRIQSFEIEI